jgi:hypothetical protein
VSVIVVVAALIVVASAVSPAQAPSPYASALSGLAAGTALAAPPSCGNTGCNRLGHCSKVRGYNCDYSAGECQQSAC